ncbi:tetratricopeptide repeat protein, partial [bacterium]|nr:tetratricopeptide repeat protein [candidate division CSSED10-310 bacterium]
ALYEPRFSELPGQADYEEPAQLEHNANRLRLFTYLSQTLTELIKVRPLLIILDDLHWADELTSGFLSFVLHTGLLNQLPLFIIGAYRIEEMNENLQRMLKSPKVNQINITRFSEQEVGVMVADMMALKEPPEIFVPFITQYSEGNPFFIAEYLRTAVSEGLLYRDEEGNWQICKESREKATLEEFEALPLPRSIQQLVQHRLSALPLDALQITQTAAIVGREMDVMLLWHIITFSGDILDAMDDLIRRQIFEETSPGRIRFVNDIIRQIAYEQMPQDTRRHLHKLVVNALESLYPEKVEESKGDLAFHWAQAGYREKSAMYYLEAAENAIKQASLNNAERYYSAFLNLVEEDNLKTLEVRNKIARNILLIQGKYKEAEKLLYETISFARQLSEISEEAQSLLTLADIQRIQGDLIKARELSEQARTLYQRQGDIKGVAICFRSLGQISFAEGSLDIARELLEKALTFHRDLNDRSNEGITIANLAKVFSRQGHIDKALQLYEQAVSIHKKVGNRIHVSPCLANIAVLYNFKGKLDVALRLYRESLKLHKEIGDRRSESVTLSNIASLLFEMGKLKDVESLFNEALEIQREIGDKGYEGKTLRSLALFYYHQKQYENSEKLLNQALQLHKEVNDPYAQITALRNLAFFSAEKGDLETAFRYLDEALDIDRNIGYVLDEKYTQLHVAQLLRRTKKEYRKADKLAKTVELFSRDLENINLLILSLCEREHLALAKGKSTGNFFRQAKTLAEKYGITATSEAGKALDKLNSTIIAKVSGEKLIRGERRADLPERLLERIS